MRESPVGSSKETKSSLEIIEKRLQDKKHAEALAEIRDFECTHKIEELASEELFQFLYLRASVLRFSGRYQDALTSAQRAFSLVRGSGDDRKLAQTQLVLGLIHVSLGNLKDAEMEIRDALTGFRRVSDLKGLLSALSKLAFIESIRGNLVRSIELLRDALEICDKTNDEKDKGILCGNLGARLALIGRWEEAEENLRFNVEFNERSKDGANLVRGLLSLGYLLCLKRRFGDAADLYEKALRLIHECSLMREMAVYCEYYAEMAFSRGNHSLAKDHCRSGIKIGEQIAPGSAIVSQTYRLLAEVQIAEKEYDQALSSCDRAIKVATSLGEKIEIGAIHRALGQIHTAKGERQKAKENFDKSICILQQIGAKYELGKAYLEAVKSNAYEYVDRVAHYARGREIFKELESDYHVAMITLAFCEFLCQRGEHEKAEVHLTDAERILKRLNHPNSDTAEKRDLDSVLELRSRIDRALGKIGAPGAKKRAEYRFSDVVTRDPRMLALLEQARRFKDTDVPILVEGETGTGKDLLAKVIHCESKRKDKRFVKVNCAAIPDSLLESELFGYRRGAFSGADRDKKGLLEEADGGTILLNEVGDLPLRLQAKILDVIEDKEVSRLGEVRPRKVDFRVMAATNKNLSQEVDKGTFRKDLYHRLNVVTLRLPPLRERNGDISLLIEHFLAKNNLPVDMEQLNVDHLLDYRWPGNIRELENEFRRYTSVSDLMDGLSRWDKESEENDSGKLTEMEKRRIIEATRKANGKQEAAELLGISLATLYRKIKLYGLDL
jgi:transcriptional regulator with PAS, ATPase and Fis domain